MAERAKTKKESRPRLDAVIRHIRNGSYDEEMGQLQGAISDRQRKRQEAVLGMVKEVFGESYDVTSIPEDPEQEWFRNHSPSVNQAAKQKFMNELDEIDKEELAKAEKRALKEEERLKSEMGLPDDEDSPDIESRSPQIGSISDPPEYK